MHNTKHQIQLAATSPGVDAHIGCIDSKSEELLMVLKERPLDCQIREIERERERKRCVTHI